MVTNPGGRYRIDYAWLLPSYGDGGGGLKPVRAFVDRCVRPVREDSPLCLTGARTDHRGHQS
jgi:hypothetical protein